MDLFEYQGKQYFARYGIPVSAGGIADTVDEAVAAGRQGRLPGRRQGPGPGGGTGQGRRDQAGPQRRRRPAATPQTILGLDIKGHIVRRLWVEHASDIAKEYYASFTLDRGAKKHLGMVSARGGVDIEQVAAEEPDAIARLHIDPSIGLTEGQARQLVEEAGLDPRPATAPSGSCSTCTAATSRATPTSSRSTR